MTRGVTHIFTNVPANITRARTTCRRWGRTGARGETMTLRTGHKNANAHGFTLIELVLVMAMLVVVLGIAFPSLSNFFRARNLDSEARRFVSLARYGQSRAVSEGVPTVLWIDAKRRMYGLELQPGYTTDDA